MLADELYLWNEGTHQRAYQLLGAHFRQSDTRFAVWAPNATGVSVVGDFNGWDANAHPLSGQGNSGVWIGEIPGVRAGQHYKYSIASANRPAFLKADPVAFACETPPKTASTVCNLDYSWGDGSWMDKRGGISAHDAPVSIYELHLGSWQRPNGALATYRNIALPLAEYIVKMGFTHVEFMPVMEHPFYGSWGYQVTGYFAPSSRYGTPQDLMFLIDTLHQHGIGVILDWVPGHFPGDEHGLYQFDGTHLYEHADPRKGFQPEWTSYVFNYGRHEVKSFLVSSAMFWFDRYHIDGLRVDGVASMLYLDYSRGPGQWIANEDGSNENREAVSFLQKLNADIYAAFPGVQTIAEESTAWPGVSRPTFTGGLGFGYKWDLGWMNDTLKYISRDPVHRRHHQNELTFRAVYAHSENYVLPLSHDEVVHGKGSLLSQMPGDEWQKLANLRLLYGYMYGLPGKKLLFMGAELAPFDEWHHNYPLNWSLQDAPNHAGIQNWVRDLNGCYRNNPSLHLHDTSPIGFAWLDRQDVDNSVLSFLRKGDNTGASIAVVCNFTPVPRQDYRVGVPKAGVWTELLNSDSHNYGGSGIGNLGSIPAEAIPFHGHEHSIALSLPPLACLFLRSPAS